MRADIATNGTLVVFISFLLAASIALAQEGDGSEPPGDIISQQLKVALSDRISASDKIAAKDAMAKSFDPFQSELDRVPASDPFASNESFIPSNSINIAEEIALGCTSGVV